MLMLLITHPHQQMKDPIQVQEMALKAIVVTNPRIYCINTQIFF
jgi:hypothetical protein